MKPSLLTNLAVLAAAVVLLPATAFAFPPAPHHTLYGVVRDEYGNPLTDTTIQILLISSTGGQVTTTVSPGLAPGVNYELEVPMDAGNTADLYENNALTTAASYQLFVVIGTTTNLPIQMLGGYAQLGKPTGETHMDLFLGQDANGDGLPDAWEYQILAALGLPANLSLLTPGGDPAHTGMSNYSQFIAGTYPFDPSDTLRLQFVSMQGGLPVVQFQAITGRTYSVMGSPDAKEWTSMSFQVPAEGPTAATRPYIYASGVQTLQLQIVQPATAPAMQFFRLMVQ